MTAVPASLALGACPGPSWHWLSSAAEMAAEVLPEPAGPAWARYPGPEPAGPAWPGYPRMATRTPGAGADSVRVAREFAAGTLRRWGVGERGDDVVVVASELLTNALRYAMPRPPWPRWPVRLGLLQPGPWVLCAVCDPSHELPVPRDPGWYGESGRGLHVVASLCDAWGCTEPGPRGKVVWAMFETGRPW